MKSWRTTLAGWLVVIGGIATQLSYLLDNDPNTVISVEAIVTLLAGIGLIAARDNGVTSEEAGAGKK